MKSETLIQSEVPKPVLTVTQEEYLTAEAAFGEWLRAGATTRRCPRCGGRFVFMNGRVAYRISCGDCDFRITSRGV
jgi:ribosomal protein S27AE